jgi:hypothetical protein
MDNLEMCYLEVLNEINSNFNKKLEKINSKFNNKDELVLISLIKWTKLKYLKNIKLT